ncbi:MAG: TolC family protein [Flavobacteriales bacterium]|nr:TolC family protein [Flavobacteriales bacterium]
MKFIYFQLLIIIISFQTLFSQEIMEVNLEQCYTWADENFPLVQDLDLIKKTTEYSVKNAIKSNLPHLTINGQATHQSAVTSLPFSSPTMNITPLSKDQYKIYSDLFLPLTDRSKTKIQKENLQIEGDIEIAKTEAKLLDLKERIQQIYFGILLLKIQSEQIDLIKKDLDSSIEKTKAGIKNGTSTYANLALLEAESINTSQKQENTQINTKAYIQTLSLITGKNINSEAVFITPKSIQKNDTINRPELNQFNLETEALNLQNKLINKNKIPSVGLFLQSGYGRPALNFLSNNFQWYYLGGIRFSWDISQFYTNKNTLDIIKLNKSKIENQKRIFLLNTQISQNQNNAEIKQLEVNILNDSKILELRKSIKETAKVQLENGIITTLDFINYINAEYNARETLELHKIQLLMLQYKNSIITGN